MRGRGSRGGGTPLSSQHSRHEPTPEECPMPITQFTSNPPPREKFELPAEGFPYSEQELREWFRGKYARAASDLEIGVIMEAMAARDDGKELSNEAWGWKVEPAASTERLTAVHEPSSVSASHTSRHEC